MDLAAVGTSIEGRSHGALLRTVANRYCTLRLFGSHRIAVEIETGGSSVWENPMGGV